MFPSISRNSVRFLQFWICMYLCINLRSPEFGVDLCNSVSLRGGGHIATCNKQLGTDETPMKLGLSHFYFFGESLIKFAIRFAYLQELAFFFIQVNLCWGASSLIMTQNIQALTLMKYSSLNNPWVPLKSTIFTLIMVKRQEKML